MEPQLWEIILDVLLLEANDYLQFNLAFYPILETFPQISSCSNTSPTKKYWIRRLYGVKWHGIAGVPENRVDHPRGSIEEDARGFAVDMEIRRGITPKHVRFHRYTRLYSRIRVRTGAELNASNKRNKY